MPPSSSRAAARPRRLRRLAALTAATALIAAACGDDGDTVDAAGSEAGGDVPTIVVTTSIWADVVENLACGDQAEIVTVIPIGGDPHAFEASLADRGAMEDAALVVANGLLLEETLEDTIDAVEDAGTPVVRVADTIDTIEFSGDHEHGDDEHEGDDHGDDEHGDDEHEGEDHDHDHDGDDPHVWFDPARVSAVLPELATHLVDDAGLDADAVEACLDAYQAELAAVDAEIEELVATVPADARLLVTNHESLGYFADRYGFEVIGTVIPAPSGLAETNPAQLEELAELIEASGVPAVFAESQHSSQDAEALAARVGDIDVVTLFTDSLGEPDSGADTYVGLLLTTATLVADALS